MLTVPRYPSHSSSKGGILHNHSAIIIAKELTLCCVAHSLSCVQLFVTPWTAACQASLSFTTSQSLLKLISIKSVMPSNHLILCHPLLLLLLIFPSIRVFSNESVLHIRSDQIWAGTNKMTRQKQPGRLTPLP